MCQHQQHKVAWLDGKERFLLTVASKTPLSACTHSNSFGEYGSWHIVEFKSLIGPKFIGDGILTISGPPRAP